jgi:hypothetical protein
MVFTAAFSAATQLEDKRKQQKKGSPQHLEFGLNMRI